MNELWAFLVGWLVVFPYIYVASHGKRGALSNYSGFSVWHYWGKEYLGGGGGGGGVRLNILFVYRCGVSEGGEFVLAEAGRCDTRQSDGLCIKEVIIVDECSNEIYKYRM